MLGKAKHLAKYTEELAASELHWGVDDQDTLEWLIDEVERANKKVLEAMINTRNKTASRCSEIADNAKYNDHLSPSDYEEACLDIYDKICEEFNLPKAD